MAEVNLTQILNSEPFSVVNMVTALVEQERVGSLMSTVLPWTVVYSRTTYMAIDRKQKHVHLIGTVARGAPLPQFVPFDRDLYQLPIPRTGERGEVSVDEILDKRRFGGNDLEDLTELRDERIQDTKNSLDNTDNFSKGLMLRGIMADAKTGAQICDLNEIRGYTQIVVKWDLTTNDPNEDLADIKRQIIDRMGGAVVRMNGFKMLCGRMFYRYMHKNPAVKAAWVEYSAIIKAAAGVSRLGMSDLMVPGGFVLADNVEIIDMGDDRYHVYDQNPASATYGQSLGSQGVIPDWTAFVCPNAPGLYVTAYGPSSKAAFVGTIQPYYVMPRVKLDDEGIEWDVDTFRANVCLRPELIVEVEAAQGFAADGVTPVPLAADYN